MSLRDLTGKEMEDRYGYKALCISIYTHDLEELDFKLRTLRELGFRKVTRSSLIRHALDMVDLDKVPGQPPKSCTKCGETSNGFGMINSYERNVCKVCCRKTR